MSVVAIFGAGELGGALASKLAARARIREIRLIDAAAGVAAGKALDILQAAPIEQSATRITAPSASTAASASAAASAASASSASASASVAADDTAAIDAAADASVIVLADQIGSKPGTPPVEIQGEAGLTLLRRVRARNARAPIVCAGASQAWLIAHATAELSIARAQIIGSAPYALVSALRALVALELNGSAQDVSLTLAGAPPNDVIVPWHAASANGDTLDHLLDHATLRRLDAKVRYLWPPGPYALAAAASRFVEALIFGSPRTFCGFISTGGHTTGAAPRAVALPLRLDANTGARALDVPSLSAMQRSALDLVLPR